MRGRRCLPSVFAEGCRDFTELGGTLCLRIISTINTWDRQQMSDLVLALLCDKYITQTFFETNHIFGPCPVELGFPTSQQLVTPRVPGLFIIINCNAFFAGFSLEEFVNRNRVNSNSEEVNILKSCLSC